VGKYKKGERIKDLIEFVNMLNRGCMFYWRHKVLSPAFLRNWSIIQIENSIKYGILFEAIKLKKGVK